MKFTGYNSNMKENARALRRDMTPQERHLWYDFLRSHPIKFYRQRSIDRFIVDFYCSRAHLVIELDGSRHYTPEGREYDRERSEILEKYNLKVIRFRNDEVDNDFDGVCAVIEQMIREGLKTWED